MTKTPITRRSFLRTAAAFAVPTIIPATAIGAGDRPVPSNRIAMAAIGVHNMGENNMKSFAGQSGVQMVAVCDVDRGIREKAKTWVEQFYARQSDKGTYKGCDVYNDFRDLLARSDIDAVCISTPEHWHAIMSVEAAKAGKDIYCEKPLSLTIREARAMVNAVRRYGRVFQTGSQQRSEYRGMFRMACEWVRNGRIGKVLTVHCGVGETSGDCHLPAERVPAGLDWDMWLGPAPWRPFNRKLHPYSWRPYRDYSGGQMTNFGSHHFDIAQWGLDMDHSGPVEVIPPGGKDVKRLTYRYANGVLMYRGGADSVKFTGTDGVIEVSRSRLRTDPESIAKTPLGPNDIRLREARSHRGDFLECVRTRKRSICDVEIGCRSVTVCHIGNIAWWLNRSLRWDPEKEEFIGDAEANRWLDRPKRAPWTI
ncbi:MAG: Gfo/Idh/MocA family oxidoreductase [Planctomycetota bacterium]